MNSSRSGNFAVKPVFVAAKRLSDPEERRAYLDEACGDDSEMRRRVEGLLAVAEGHESSPLDDVVEHLGHAADDTSLPADGDLVDIETHPMIGPYKLLEQLGEGGMGTVYMAQQETPVRRRVALKLIKPGMDSEDVIARFEAERQALAMMDHSNIARIFDGGLTEQGRPYFVMELVRGLPIDKYCDRGTLSVSDRLKLFIDTCHALQHAHQKGIIHRDLKPSNILVTLHDGISVVKVIDFGIAKALEHKLTDRTLFTRFAEMVGTPEYMSPEQAELSGLDVDTRSDVYSLGVLLYKLLVGVPPFDEKTLRSAGLDEMRRIIREDDPPRPSRRVSTLEAEQSSTVCESRGTDPRTLSLSMRRELDWVVMKALEKDRERRYESASALALDVKRYLDDEPVHACPPSVPYRLRKLAQRNKVAITSTVLVFVALILGTVVSLWQARQANQARRLAEQKSRQLEEQRNLARRNEAFARQLVYAADVRLAAQAWESGDLRHYAELLDRYSASASASNEELGGFEWRYLRQLGKPDVHTIADGDAGFCSVRYSSDGRFLATGRYDGTIQIWNMQSDRLTATLNGHVGLVRGIDFSPDNKRLVSLAYDGVIRIWDMDSFREVRSIKAFDGAHGYRVCFALDGQAVIAIAQESPAKLWDVSTGELLDAFGANGTGCWGLAVSPDGRSCVVRENHTDFRIQDLNTRQHVGWIHFPIPGESAYCMLYSPDGAFIAAGTDEKTVRLYDACTGKLVNSFSGHTDDIQDIAFHSTSTILASCDRGGVIRSWLFESTVDIDGRNSSQNWPASFAGHKDRVWSLDFSPDGNRLVSASRDGTVRAWAGRSEPQQELDVPEAVASRFLSSDDGLVIVSQNMLSIWDSRTGEARPFGQSFKQDALSLDVSPDGSIIATGHTDGTVRLWNRATQQVTRLLQGHKDRIKQIAFSPDSTQLMTASWDGTSILWDAATATRLQIIETPPHSVSTAFSPDGQTFAVSSENDAMIYDAHSAKRRYLLRGHQHTAKCVAFSPDGRWLATGSDDRTVRIWDVQTGKAKFAIPAHREQIYSLSFSPDGRTIVTGDERGNIAFSHVETGRFLFGVDVAESEISCLSFSPDGTTLAVTCFDKDVILLHAPDPGNSQ